MKKRHVLTGIAGLALVFGMVLAGCNNTVGSNNVGDNSNNTGDNTGNSNTGGNGTPATTIPGVPSGLSATALSKSELLVAWPPVPGASTYEMTDGSKTYTAANSLITVSGLNPDTSYTFSVKAGNTLGWSALSSPVTGKTFSDSIPTDLTLPGAPGWVTAEILSSTEIRVSWGTVTGATNYLLYYSTQPTGEPQAAVPASSPPVTVTGLQGGTTYYFTVTAGNGAGFSAGTVTSGKTEKAATYTVTYHANGGGSTLPVSQTEAPGVSVTVSGQGGLKNPGYGFWGWNTKANGTGRTYAAGDSLTLESNVTLYAKWGPEPALRTIASPTSASGPVVLDSYTDMVNNYYLLDVGAIDYTYVADIFSPQFYNGNSPIGMSDTTITTDTVSTAMTNALENSIMHSHTEGSLNGVEVGTEGGWAFVFEAKGSLKGKREWSSSATDEATVRWSEELQVSEIQSFAKENAINVSFGGQGGFPGWYRYSVYAVSKVNFIVTTNRDNTELISLDTLVSVSTMMPHTDYSPDGTFDTSPEAGNTINLPENFLRNLKPPASSTPMVSLTGGTIAGSGSDGVFISGRTVTLRAFRIAKYETTYQLWKEVYDWATAHGYTFANPGVEGHGTNGTGTVGTAAQRATRPVTTINWRDAIVWCNAYSEMSDKVPVYTYSGSVIKDSRNTNATACDGAVMDMTKNGYRLPTEAEWEYAARGGNQSDTTSWAYTYAGGNTVGNVAWYNGNSSNLTSSNADYGAHPVGDRKAANSKGLYDMSGNVIEWCWDWHGSISTSTLVTGAVSGTYRVARGGCWGDIVPNCAVTRHGNGAIIDLGNFNIGFRIVCL